MKHVDKITWEHLKEESAADLHVTMHHHEATVTRSDAGETASRAEEEHPPSAS